MQFSKIGFAAFLALLIVVAPVPNHGLTSLILKQGLAQTTQASLKEAERLYEQGRKEFQASQFEAALKSYQQALQLYRQLKNGPGEVKTLRGMGNIDYARGNAVKATDYYQQSLNLARQVKDREGERFALQNLGVAYEARGEYPKALEYHQQTLKMSRELKDRQGEADAVGNLGTFYLALGGYQQSIEYLQQQLTITREIKDRQGEGNALGNLGIAYYSLGKYPQAIEHHQQHLAISRARQDVYGEKTALNNLGNDYHAIGNYGKALDYLRQSLEISEKIGDRRGQAQSLGNIGVLYSDIGEFSKAILHHRRSLTIAQEIQDIVGEAQALGNLGNAYYAVGDYDTATQAHEKRLAIAQAIGSRTGEATALNNLGNIHKSKGQYPEAIASFQKTLAISRELKDRAGEETALGNLGVVYAAQKNYPKAIEAQQQAAAIAQELQDPLSQGIALNNLGNAFFLSGKPGDAEQALYKALAAWESLRAGLGGNDANKISIFDQQARTYRLLQRVLVAQNKTDAALEVAERGRARAFVELLAERITATQSTIEPPNIAQIKQIAKAQNATLVEYSITYEDIQVEGREEARESELLIWVVKPSGEVAFRRSDLKPLWQCQGKECPTPLANLISSSRENINVRGRGLAFTEKPEVVARASEEVERQSFENQKLYQLLIQPIADLLPKNPNDRVVFIPQQSLFLVPFPALQDAKGNYLIQKHTVLIAPSIQALELTRQQRQKLATGSDAKGVDTSALVVGNPTMPSVRPSLDAPPQQLPDLPGTEREARAIASLLNTQAILGDAATKETVLKKLPQARLIHLATHGLLEDFQGTGIPGAIALAPSGQDDGLLNASEIFNLNLNAELVVLSACDTGRGKITGDGVIGLSRSLISAGVPSVVVSLWQVPDLPTAALMTEFYQNLQNTSDKAQALRQAMLTTMQQYPSPQDWAAFTLIGEAE